MIIPLPRSHYLLILLRKHGKRISTKCRVWDMDSICCKGQMKLNGELMHCPDKPCEIEPTALAIQEEDIGRHKNEKAKSE